MTADRMKLAMAIALLTVATPCAAVPRDLYAALSDVNREVNSTALVDCKDLAKAKIERLQSEGIEAKFVVVRTETGNYHAIAVVDGKWALDKRQTRVVTIKDLRREGYWISPLVDARGTGTAQALPMGLRSATAADAEPWEIVE